MERIVYRHGDFVPESEAKVSIFDRGFLFGDSVYEVTAVQGGRLVDNDLHLARLERSLGELGIPMPLTRAEIEQVQLELRDRNGLTDGVIYLQVSRGAEDRDFLPGEGLKPLLIGFTQPRGLEGWRKRQAEGISVDLAEDPRWERRDIKTTMLLGQVLAKRAAKDRGFDDVWLMEEGFVTESASSTAWIVTREGKLVTRGNSHAILPGCTRGALFRICEEAQISIEERAFTPEEAQAAAEAFNSSAGGFVTPVVKIGAAVIGDGAPGPITRRLQALYLAAAQSEGQSFS